MDLFEINKIVGAVLFTLLLVLGMQQLAGVIYAPHVAEKPGYAIEVAEKEPAKEEAEAKAEPKEESLAVLLAAADADAGQKVARKCTTCHTFEEGGPDRVGPNLYGILGRGVAAAEGFNYSDALAAKAGEIDNWSYEALDAFVADPKAFAAGTKMAFAGIRKAADRADLIAYLRSLSASPPPLPQPEEAVEPAAAPAAEETPAGDTEAGAAAEPGQAATPDAEAQPPTDEAPQTEPDAGSDSAGE